MEVPQQIIFHALTKDKTKYDIEIVDYNYTLPVNHKRFSVGDAKQYNDCVDDPSKCPLLPMPHQFKHYVYENRNGKEVIIGKLYGPYYGSTYLMLFFDTFKAGGDIRFYKHRYIERKGIYKYLENQKSSQKGENNGDN